jgi:catalase
LPINAPRNKVATNQRDGQMAYHQDLVPGVNPHINYEPSSLGGLKEAQKAGKDYEPSYTARLVRQKIDRTNDFKQAGDTYRNFEDWERDELINNLVNTLANTNPVIQEKMIENFTKADADYGRRVAEGLKNAKKNIGEVGAPSGATKTEEGVQQAEKVSKEARPY